MKTRIIITTVVIAAIHLFLAICSLLIAFGYGMEAFDNPEYEPSGLEVVARHLAAVLLQPGASIWTPWMSKNMPDAVEWGLFLINSLLWGIVFALLIDLSVLLRRRRPDKNIR